MNPITAPILVLVSLLPIATHAQITITQNDLPQAGDVWVQYDAAEGGPQFMPTPAGGNQTWNWANALSGDETNTLQWVIPSWAVAYEDFPSATLALTDESSSSFMRSEPTGLYSLGSYYANGGSTSIMRIEGGLVLPTPFTVGSNRTELSVSTALILPGDEQPAMKYVTHYTYSYTCGAWGTLHTPVFPSGVSVLRLDQTEISGPDSSFIDVSGSGNGPWTLTNASDEPVTSNWHIYVQSGNPTVVAETSSSGGSVYYYAPGLPNGLTDFASYPAPVVFPVPTREGSVSIRPNNKAAVRVEVINTLGETLHNINTQGVDLIQLGTQGYAPGTYLFRCLDAAGLAVGQGRFIVGE